MLMGFEVISMRVMKKKSVLQLALQLNFWVVKDICNSLYLYAMTFNRQVAWVAKLQLIVYMVQLIVIQLHSVKVIHFQLLFNSIITSHDVMFDVINCHQHIKIWHVALWFFLWNIDFHRPSWLLMTVRICDMWHKKKLPHGI
jgi:hypothetical protein